MTKLIEMMSLDTNVSAWLNPIMRIACVILLFFATSGAQAKTECPDGEHWVYPHFRSAYVRHDGVHVSAAQVRGHCRMNPRGYDQWHERLSNHRPSIWGYRTEKSKKWSIEDVQRFYDEMSVLPDKLIGLDNVKLHRMDISGTKRNPATSNFNDVVFYDLAFQHSDSLAQIIAHELSHVVYSGLSEEDRAGFRQAARWIQESDKPGIYAAAADKKLIQPDSGNSVSEDFANHIEHYLFKNESLKKTSPKVHEWIQSTFGSDFKAQGVKNK